MFKVWEEEVQFESLSADKATRVFAVGEIAAQPDTRRHGIALPRERGNQGRSESLAQNLAFR
jgi:hypothetical protein